MPVVLIAGPTASGKSGLALELAERIGGTVINADSMQVYRELRILTARPGREDETRAPHRLYGHVSIREAHSVGRWLDCARGALDESTAAGRIAIVVGGTGLYFKALTEGLSAVPDVPASVRSRIRARLEAEGADVLHAELRARDPTTAARIPPSDPQRIARALEVLDATGRSLAEWQRTPVSGALVDPQRALRLILWPDRDWLRSRIDLRFDAMIGAGVLEEAREVMELDLDPDLPGYRAHGLRPLIAHLRGEIALDEAAERTKAETRQYAKRQFTWFRHQMADWRRVDPLKIDSVANELNAFR